MEYNQLLEQLESQRQVIKKRMLYSIGIIIVTLLLGLLIGNSQGIVFGGIIGLVFSVAYVGSSASKYKQAFKNQLMPLIIAKTGMDLKYDYKDGVGKNTVMGSKLFKKPDRYHCEDLMYGTFDDVQFMASDVHMEEKHVTTDKDGHRRVEYITYFKGRWFVYDFNKEFNGIIQVREDGFFGGAQWGLNVEKISLEDVEFNKKFKTYASNQHDAFYVLTPTLMVNMKNLEKRFPGRIYFSFIGSQLHIAIYSSADSFEPPIFKPIDDAFVSSQVEDILILKQIVEELRLNRKIFKQ
ncbi:DUF3137 domain-containing protein [Mycoplasmatota bacterium]|nr:DUF3137 domain-containing protein [Mycoplasmatota bacterium]